MRTTFYKSCRKYETRIVLHLIRHYTFASDRCSAPYSWPACIAVHHVMSLIPHFTLLRCWIIYHFDRDGIVRNTVKSNTTISNVMFNNTDTDTDKQRTRCWRSSPRKRTSPSRCSNCAISRGDKGFGGLRQDAQVYISRFRVMLILCQFVLLLDLLQAINAITFIFRSLQHFEIKLYIPL